MTPERRNNLERLLRPRHVALIGGRDAEVVAGECRRIGYGGAVWPVNPKRASIGGHKCFASIGDLPEAPDAVFLAIPVTAAIDAVRQLRDMGAGGCVCYTAGFGELGREGATAQAELVEAAGDMALVGPNCYGLINYLDKVALWPFGHGGWSPGHGAAIITQSGMLASDLAMNQRSVPLSCMISAGNQAVLALEDFIEALSSRDEVRAIGLHIEGLKDVPRFAAAALKAAQNGVPIVALKTGTSRAGAELTVSHTGSLSGADELYEALFDRFGIIRVTSPTQLLETLKFLCIAGMPNGRRVAGFTCSGGGATMLADHGERLGLAFPRFGDDTAARLKDLLPHTATVSNPLDYTTPIWGFPDKVTPVFRTALADGLDAAVLVQDYPLEELDADKQSYLNDAGAFITATREAGIPAAVASTLPENIDAETRRMLCEAGIAPMQGLPEALEAIATAAWHGARMATINENTPALPVVCPVAGEAVPIDEWHAKQLLQSAGISVPDGRLATGDDAAVAAADIGYPVAAKMVSSRLAHKTEAGAVALGLSTAEEVATAIARMRRDVAAYDPAAVTDRFIVEAMVERPVCELLVNVRNDARFGLAMTLGSGGVLVELVGDATTLLLPASDQDLDKALACLKADRLLRGMRGTAGADRGILIHALQRLVAYALQRLGEIAEIEINPLFVMADRVVAVDALARSVGDGPVDELCKPGRTDMSAKQVIGDPVVIGGRTLSLSRAIRAGDFVFLTGQVPFKDGAPMTTGTIEDQTRAVLDDITATLALAGCTRSDVVKAMVWLTDRADFPGFNAVYGEYFPEAPPARSAVVTDLLVDVRVEVEVVAYKPQ